MKERRLKPLKDETLCDYKASFVDTAKEETSVFDPNRLLYLCSSDADSSQAATSSSDNGVETTRQKRSSRQISVRWHTVHMLQS